MVAEWVERRAPDWSGRPLLLGMSWIGDHLEAVLTHPTDDDRYGSKSPADVIRIAATGEPVVRSHPLGCTDCFVLDALPGANGWTMVVRAYEGREDRVLLADGSGSAVPAPPALAWWDQFNTNRAALGTLWAASGYGERSVERDGSLSEPVAPLAG